MADYYFPPFQPPNTFYPNYPAPGAHPQHQHSLYDPDDNEYIVDDQDGEHDDHDQDPDGDQDPDEQAAPGSAGTAGRICSLKGCGVVLKEDYNFKMCEGCRVKHQAYSRVKRNKRRQEKIDAGVILRQRGPNKPKPQLYRVNGELAIDPKWEYLDRRLFGPRPNTPPLTPSKSTVEEDNRPLPKDGYRRKPLPAKDEGAIEFNFILVKVCSIKGCYQPIPASYERKTCIDCQERCKEYSVRKRAKIRANKADKGPPRRPANPAIPENLTSMAVNMGDDIPIDPAIAQLPIETTIQAAPQTAQAQPPTTFIHSPLSVGDVTGTTSPIPVVNTNGAEHHHNTVTPDSVGPIAGADALLNEDEDVDLPRTRLIFPA